MVDIWREIVQVRFGSVDRSDRLTLWSIFNFFQEAAISHAADLGVGRDTLAQSKQAWILSRLSLIVERRPAYGETVQVSTWPRHWEKLFALRDYQICDGDGIPVVRGRGAWLILDAEKRIPLRIQPIVESLPPNDGIDAFPAAGTSRCPAALGPGENLIFAARRRALYSDIDYYGHVNNARYIQWIQDITDMEILASSSQLRFEINYLSEVMPGDKVELLSAQSGKTGFAYEGRKSGTDKTVFRAELYITLSTKENPL